MSELWGDNGRERMESPRPPVSSSSDEPHTSADIPLAGRQAVVQIVRALAVAGVALIGALCGYIVGRLV